MIEFKNVTKKYNNGEVIALDNASFKINKGEFVFLIGKTGAGKTTATKLILKEEETDSGIITVNDVDLSGLKRKDIPIYRRNIGAVFQDSRLIPYKTVGENVLLSMDISGITKRNADHMLPQILELAMIKNKEVYYPEELSGGEKQKAAMARAMATNPPILIADEPTGNLDPESSLIIMDLFERFNKLGTTVLVISHDMQIVKNMQKRVIKLDDGKVVNDSFNI